MTTQFATASYQEIIDLHTETDKVSVIGIHTPVTDTPYNMLEPFFDAFQKYHYDGCSLAMVPAARLPADPSQVSYDAGVAPIDPRDMLNPILWHGCHGESLGSVLNQFYCTSGSSTDVNRKFFDSGEYSEENTAALGDVGVFESLYYRALVDKTWLKAHPQRGFRKSGLRPLVYEVSTDRQFLPSNYGNNAPYVPRGDVLPGDPSDNDGIGSSAPSGNMGNAPANTVLQVTQSLGLQRTITNAGGDVVANMPQLRDSSFFTSRLHGLGWLDTRQRVFNIGNSSGITSDFLTGDEEQDAAILSNMYANAEDYGKINYLPRLFMGMILMPPAYKTEQYFRIILNHRFSFRKYRGVSMRGDIVGRIGPGAVPSYQNFN